MSEFQNLTRDEKMDRIAQVIAGWIVAVIYGVTVAWSGGPKWAAVATIFIVKSSFAAGAPGERVEKLIRKGRR